MLEAALSRARRTTVTKNQNLLLGGATAYSTTCQPTGHSLRAVRALTDEALRSMSTQLELVLDDGWPVEPAGAVTPRIAVRGALQGPQRTAADGGTGLQPAVPVVRRVEQGRPSGPPTTWAACALARSR